MAVSEGRTDVRGLKVTYLIQQFPPEVGAGPARAVELARRWRDAGAEVTIVTALPNRPQGRIYDGYRGRPFLEERYEGMRVLRSWLFASPEGGVVRTVANNVSFLATGGLHAAIRAGGCDVAIASSPPFLVHLAGDLLRRVRRVPLVLEVRDLWPDYMVDMEVVRSKTGQRALFGLERHLLNAATRVVVVSDPFRERIAEKGVPRQRISVVPNGVDLERYGPTGEPPPIETLRRRDGEFVAGYLGNFGMGQDLARVLEAMAVLRDEGAAIRLVLAGDGPERSRLEALRREMDLENVALHGPIPKARTRAFYGACDACLVPLADYPALRQTIPSKLFEILACERPVVGAMAGEGARILERSGGGIVTEPGRPRAIAAAIRRMAEIPAEERAEMGRRGRAYVARHFDRDSQAADYLDLLVEAAGGRSTLRPAGDPVA